MLLFLFFTFHFSLFAQNALPPLVPEGETFTDRKALYIDNRTAYNAVAISPDGKYIVSGSDDHSIKIWETTSGKLLQSLEGHTSYVNSVAISPDGRRIVSGSGDKSIKIWETTSGKPLQSLEGHSSYVMSVAISPDGRRIVSGFRDGSIKIWETTSGKLLQSLEGHTDSVFSVAITPDGRRIVSGSDDNSIKIWDREREWNDTHELIGSRDGNWVTFVWEPDARRANKQYLLRGDDGTLLLRKTAEIYENNATTLSFKPQSPKKKETEDNLTITANSVTIKSDQSTTITLHLINETDHTTYQLKAQSHSDYGTIAPNLLYRIEPHQALDFNLSLYALLDRNNTHPIQAYDFNLTLRSSSGNEFNVTIPLTIHSAQVKVVKAEESEDQKTLYVEIENSGTSPLIGAKAQLTQPFKAEQDITETIPVKGKQRLAFALPENNATLDENMTVDLLVYVPNIEEERHYTRATKVAPLYSWEFPYVTIVLSEWAWYIYALWAAGIMALLIAIYYYRRYKNPMVIRLANTPNTLFSLTAKELLEAQTKLSTIDRWQSLLETTKTTQERFDETLAFYQEPTVTTFANRIEAQSVTEQAPFYKLMLPESLGLTIDNFLLYLTDQPLDALKELQNRSDKVMVITRESYQDAVAEFAHDKTNRIIAPTQAELTTLLLGNDPREVLVTILARCLSFKHLSPYQTNLGVRSDENFFGRTDIVRDIITSERKNYLIVGSRQLGKTAILQALERRYPYNSQVDCYMFNLEHDDILDLMNSALELAEESSLETIVKTISQKAKKSIFLIDEADFLLAEEKANGYRVTSAFRKLAQEDKATFVLAGFWVLYEYVVLDYQSALKNFGELIILEGLEPEACRDLMVKPMQRIGVTYADEAMIEEMIARCGYRANLIATICSSVLEQIEGNTIHQADIDKVLLPSARKALKAWEQLSPDPTINRINKIVVYLTIGLDHFRLEDIVALVEQRQLPISITQIKKSLEQLVLGYILEEHQERYRYRVPLFVEMFAHTNIETHLKGEIIEL